jgi:hypothetical protein
MNHRKQQETDDGFVSVPPKIITNNSKNQQTAHGRKPRQGGRGRGGGRGGGGGGGGRNDPFQKKGWAKPTLMKEEIRTPDDSSPQKTSLETQVRPYQDDLSERIASLVKSEFHDQSNADDQINTAIATAAAVSLFARVAGSVDADDNKEEAQPTLPFSEPTDFRSMMKGSNMADLMADFGEQDKDWKTKEPTIVSTAEASGTTTSPSKQAFSSRLAPHGKAPIHISIESFGYIHGAVTGSRESWSPYSQPLPPLQCSDNLAEPIPSYLLFHDGLRSGHVKRWLRELPVTLENDNDEDDTTKQQQYKNLHDYARKYVAKQWIWPKIVQAQTEGQHGYVNPVTMTVSIGSQLGRHRSVAVVEWAAAEVRALLRRNVGGVLTCPVSVGTFHRDVDKKVPTHAVTDRKDKKAHDDDDDDDRI